MILDIAGEMLSYLGHKPFLASSAQEGLKIFLEKKDEIDLVIVDLLMPDMNGKECYQELRKIDPTIPIILSTGISDVAHKDGLKNLQVVGFLEKPYDMEKLQGMINKL